MRRTTANALIEVLLYAILALLLSGFAYAANNPGHDSLYIEEQGSSTLTGSLNITANLSVIGRTDAGALTLYGDGTSPGSGTFIASSAGGTDLLRINAPGNLMLKNLGGGQVVVGSTTPTDLNVTGIIYAYGNTSVCLQNGTGCPTSALGGGNVTGSGSANYLTKWTSGSAIGNSIIYDGGTNVGIGTPTPASKLDVVGNASISSNLVVNGGRNFDNNGNITIGIGMDTAKKAGIYVTDNFAVSSGEPGAYISAAVYNTGAYPGYNAISASIANAVTPYSVSTNLPGGWVVSSFAQNLPGSANSGAYRAQTNTVLSSNTGTSIGYEAFNYMQMGNLTNYMGYRTDGQFAVAPINITNVYDFYAAPYSTSGAGEIKNRYGVYIGYDNTDTVNAYGIYQTSSNVKNYFNGNVGIGTNAPNYPLSISGAVSSRPLVSINTTENQGNGYIMVLNAANAPNRFMVYDNGNFQSAGAATFNYNGGNGGTTYIDAGGGSSGSRIVMYDGSGGTQNIFNANGASFIKGGYFGINTATPGQALDVNGSVNVSGASAKIYTPELCIAGDCKTSWPAGGGGWTNTTTQVYLANNATNVSIGNWNSVPSLVIDNTHGVVAMTNLEQLRLNGPDDGNWWIGYVNSGGLGKLIPGGITFNTYSGGGGFVFQDGARPLYELSSINNTAVFWTKVGVNTTTPTQALDVNGSGNFSGTNAQVWINGSLVCTAANGLCNATGGGGNVTGGGSANYLTKWTGGSAIGNSVIYDGGTNVGIGTTDPAAKLDVNGSGKFTSDLTLACNLYMLGNGDSIHNSACNGERFEMTSNQQVEISSTYGGTSNIRLANGSVGIGTTTPIAALQVNGSTSPAIKITNAYSGNGVSHGFDLQTSGPEAYVWNYENGGLTLGTANTPRMYIQNDGNVGIGTSAPSQKLDVNGSVNVSGSICLGGVCNAAWPGGGGGGTITGSGATGNVSVFATNSTNIDASNIYYSSGNIGIGTTSPLVKLHLSDPTNGLLALLLQNGNAASNTSRSMVATGQDAGVSNVVLAYYNSNWSLPAGFESMRASGAQLKAQSGATGGLDIATEYTNANLTFTTGGVAAANERMRITSGGSVGIGTTAPTQMLHVNGTANITSAIYINQTLCGAGQYLSADANGKMTCSTPSGTSTGNVTGGGAANNVSYWTNETNLATSNVVYNAGNVGVGTSTPTGKLNVVGNVNVTNGNVSVNTNYSMCFNENCSSRIYYNGTALVIEGQ